MPVKYKLVEAPDDFWAIKILEGDLLGVVYRYGSVKVIDEQDSDGNIVIKFEFDVLESPFVDREEIKGPEIDKMFGDILQEVILSAIDNVEKEEPKENE